MIRDYVYWIAAGNRAHGEGDAQCIEALRALWRTHRLVDAVRAFDGASFWIADGEPHARVIRTAHATATHRVQVVDVDPALLLPRSP
jgi:hypothetical protein